MNTNRRQAIKYITASVAGVALAKYTKAETATKFKSSDPEVKVVNAGVGGNNTIEMLARIDKDCLALQPKLTIIMVGTNDMNSQKHVPLDQYRDNLVQMIAKIKAIDSKVLIMTILPPYEPYLLTRHSAAFYQPEGVAMRRQQTNDVIKDVAKKQKIHLLDMGQRFDAIGKVGLDKESLIQNEANTNKNDGVHPTPTGYRFMALAVYDFIADHDLPTGNIVCFGDSITHGDGTMDKESYPANLLKLLTVKQ